MWSTIWQMICTEPVCIKRSFLLNKTCLLRPYRWKQLTPTFVDSKSSLIILISRIGRVTSLDEIHMNVQCAIALYLLHIKHHKIHCQFNCHLHLQPTTHIRISRTHITTYYNQSHLTSTNCYYFFFYFYLCTVIRLYFNFYFLKSF